MAQVRTPHPNAKLTSLGRRAMVDVVVVEGWGVAATAERFGVDPKTVRKWRDRFVAEGSGGLVDRSSRPHRSPGRSSPEVRAEVIGLRRCRRRGAAWIAHEVGVAASTVQKILNEAGLGRLDRGDRATKPAPVRYQRERPGELVHVDVKKLPAIPPGGGWRVHGRGQAPTPGAKAGYRYLHTALDDRSRVAYSEILNDEQAVTAAAFYQRAHAWFSARGVVVERVLTDNGPCYRSRRWTETLASRGVAARYTRPYRPQTNGKVERFHRILLEEWAYIRPWTSEEQRHAAYQGFLHYYNHHRAHGALNWAAPASTLKDNVPGMHMAGDRPRDPGGVGRRGRTRCVALLRLDASGTARSPVGRGRLSRTCSAPGARASAVARLPGVAPPARDCSAA